MNLPDGWKYIKLSDITNPLTEMAGEKKYETLSISAGIGFVNQSKKFGKELSGKQYEKYIVLHRGDFSYNKGNSKKYPQGCIYQVTDRDCAAVPNVFESFRFILGINDYYEQLFVSGFLNHQLASKINHGIRDDGLLNLTGKDFYDCFVPFPPLTEQQKIAEILYKQDKIISLEQKLLEQKQQQKKWLMQKLLEVPYTNADCEEKFSLGGVVIDKSGWKKERLGRICTITGRIGFRGYTRDDITSSDKGVLSLSPSNIIDGQLNMEDSTFITLEKYLESPEIMIQKHDIVFVKTGSTFGKVGYLDSIYQKATINPQLVIVRSNNLVRQNLLYYILKSDYFQNFVNKIVVGGAVPTLSQEQLSKIMIHLPTLPEQEIIAQVLSAADKEIALLKSIIEQEKQKKKSLAQLLLTGTVRVNT